MRAHIILENPNTYFKDEVDFISDNGATPSVGVKVIGARVNGGRCTPSAGARSSTRRRTRV
jgi:hypothetical protein